MDVVSTAHGESPGISSTFAGLVTFLLQLSHHPPALLRYSYSAAAFGHNQLKHAINFHPAGRHLSPSRGQDWAATKLQELPVF